MPPSSTSAPPFIPAPSRPPAGASDRRFTIDGDAALERHLAATCARIASGLGGLLPASRLQGVALGGGYGRGEGGVLRTPTGDLPYNDLEFYVFLAGNPHLNKWRYGEALHVFGEILTPQAGIDIEFHISSAEAWRRSAVSMFSYDLASGHRWILGGAGVFDRCAHHLRSTDIPDSEATRLLMNRASGLLFAAQRLRRPVYTAADADFVGRNIAKAQLGVGDAVLAALRQYHWSVRERQRRLERLTRSDHARWLADVRLHYNAGVAFKLHPGRSPLGREILAAEHARVSDFCREAWLWLESRRLQTAFRSIRDYVESPEGKCPGTNPLRNIAVNLRQFGPRAVTWRHPRERILITLPLLLWQADAVRIPASLARLQALLRTPSADFDGLVTAYRRIWERVN